MAGQDFDDLLLATRRILGREGGQLNFCARSRDGSLDTRDGVGLVVFNADQNRFRRDDMRQNLRTLDQFVCLALHQRVVGSDIRFTLGTVDQQRLYRSRGPRIQFYGGGKSCSAHARNAGCAHVLNQCGGVQRSPVRDTGERQPLILTIGLDHNALILKPGGVGNGARFDRRHGAGGRRMHRHAHDTLCLSDGLPSQYTVSHIHDR